MSLHKDTRTRYGVNRHRSRRENRETTHSESASIIYKLKPVTPRLLEELATVLVGVSGDLGWSLDHSTVHIIIEGHIDRTLDGSSIDLRSDPIALGNGKTVYNILCDSCVKSTVRPRSSLYLCKRRDPETLVTNFDESLVRGLEECGRIIFIERTHTRLEEYIEVLTL